MDEPTIENLERLSRDHRQLDDTLHRYLHAIADRDPHRAEKLLDEFAARLAQHTETEERDWVPLFEQRFGKTRGFGGQLILEEHKVLDKLLGALRLLLHTIAARTRSLDAQQVLNLLEESFRLRGVFEHHHAREDNVMIPALREALSQDTDDSPQPD